VPLKLIPKMGDQCNKSDDDQRGKHGISCTGGGAIRSPLGDFLTRQGTSTAELPPPLWTAFSLTAPARLRAHRFRREIPIALPPGWLVRCATPL